MTISSTEWSQYDGGQIEVQNNNEDYLYRGEIKTARIVGNELVVTLAWMAKMGKDTKWHTSTRTTYQASLEIYSEPLLDKGRLFLFSPITGEMVSLFPSNYPSKLEKPEVSNEQ